MPGNYYKSSRRRLPHVQIGGRWYFISFNSKRGPLTEAGQRIVMETIRHDRGKRYELHLAVVMPDHVHMLIRPLEKGPGEYFDISAIIKLIKGVSSRRINQLAGVSGQLWWDEYYDTMMRDESDFAARVEYMLNNPVKAGLVERPEQYEFFVR